MIRRNVYIEKIINNMVEEAKVRLQIKILEHIENTRKDFRLNETVIKIFIDDKSGKITFYEYLFDEIEIEIPEFILKKISNDDIKGIVDYMYARFEEEIFKNNCRSAYIVTYRNGKRDRDLRISILDY